jgi:hypothetical protein
VETQKGKHLCCSVDAKFSPLHHVSAALDSDLLQELHKEHVGGQKKYFDQKRAAAAKKEKEKEEESSVSDSGPPLKKAKKAEKKEKKQKKTEVFEGHDNSGNCIAAVLSGKSQCKKPSRKGQRFCTSHLAGLGDDNSQTKIEFVPMGVAPMDIDEESESESESDVIAMDVEPDLANNNAKSEEEESYSSDLSEEEEESWH